MPPSTTPDLLLAALQRLLSAGQDRIQSSQLAAETHTSLATVKRHLEQLIASGQVRRTGRARATRYSLTATEELRAANPIARYGTHLPGDERTPQSDSLLKRLQQPLALRNPVTFQRRFVDGYQPNQTRLLPATLADVLSEEGRLQGRQPAGTYARKVLEPLLIDLSWSSSRLEGNRYSLLATRELFRHGMANGDLDAIMLLNHKRAIEFMVDAVPEYGLSAGVVRNLHAVLMQDLQANTEALGSIRQTVVNISGTAYVPTQVPGLLAEMFDLIIEKARRIDHPLEAAFFLWVTLAYLQPFEDGNKRTSRLAANIPLMLYNHAPLSFLDVDAHDYAYAMMGVYEFLDVSLAAELFAWTYRRSLRRYAAIVEAIGAPDPVRLRYRARLNEVIQLVVRERQPVAQVLATLGLSAAHAPGFHELLDQELDKLDVYNCARYQLTMRTTEDWITAGRPR